MTKACNIIAAGSIRYSKIYNNYKSLYTICADRGYYNALKLGFKADLVLGDFDSISKSARDLVKSSQVEVISFPREKDMTDTELAIDQAIKRGFDSINLFAAIGSRLDHSLANILLLYKYRNIDIKIIDENNIISFLDEDKIIKKNKNFYSILALSPEGMDLSLKGFHYNLDKGTIALGSSLGISNYIEKDFGEINLIRGYGLLFESNDGRK